MKSKPIIFKNSRGWAIIVKNIKNLTKLQIIANDAKAKRAFSA